MIDKAQLILMILLKFIRNIKINSTEKLIFVSNIQEMSKALVQHQTGKLPILEERPIPEIKEGQLLVKVEGSTVNPVDRLKFAGILFTQPLPAVLGFEATGRVIKAAGQGLQDWVGKRITFFYGGLGTWAEYTVAAPNLSFVIDEDVPLEIAASGFVNPLTALGIVDIYKKFPAGKGIIHTAAASALGRMLNKYTQRLGIPLLNIVRRQEQADLLRSEGAKHVIVTNGNWEKEYDEAIKAHGFNVLFDALGGGPVTDALIRGLNNGSLAHTYGGLEGKPITVTKQEQQAKGFQVKNYNFVAWINSISQDEVNVFRQSYSQLLKTDLSTKSYKTLSFSQIAEALQLSVSKATQGKITLVPA